MSAEYIADYEIPYLEDRFRAGDRDAGARLVRFYEAEISSMAIRRDRLLRAMAESDSAPRFVEADVDNDEDSAAALAY
jgi:hypothetical protein